MRYQALTIATAIVLSPLAFVRWVAGREGLIVFLIIIGVFIGGSLLLYLSHWAVEKVLIELFGCDRKSLNRDRCRSTVIFWRS